MARATNPDDAGRYRCADLAPQATRRLDALGALGALTLSAVSYLEVLRHRAATLLPVSEAITQRAIELMESLTLSHGLQMGDALIAATALDHGLPVLTANVKHFGAIPGLAIEAFSP